MEVDQGGCYVPDPPSEIEVRLGGRIAELEKKIAGLELGLSAARNVADSYIPEEMALHDKVFAMGTEIERLLSLIHI